MSPAAEMRGAIGGGPTHSAARSSVRGPLAHADVIIVGGGLVGLASAAALSARGATVALVAEPHPGEASRAAAGMLAPGVERSHGAAHAFAVAARDLYPSYVEALAEFTGIRVPLNRAGILELIFDERSAAARAHELDEGAEWLTRAELARVEPGAAPAAGAVLHPGDGAVDNVILLRALRTLVAATPTVTAVDERALSVEVGRDAVTAHLASGERVSAATLVVAAGAWSPLIRGLPRALPVKPMRGQMIAVAAGPLRHATYGATGYVVPRSPSLSLVGATMEDVGFEVATTHDGMARLESAGAEIAPDLATARTIDRWCGLRPVTPDMLPILGRDPDHPNVIYACGHSRNGILLGPISGECVAALAGGEELLLDLSPFTISRFDARPPS